MVTSASAVPRGDLVPTVKKNCLEELTEKKNVNHMPSWQNIDLLPSATYPTHPILIYLIGLITTKTVMISKPSHARLTVLTRHPSVQNMDRPAQKPPVFPNKNKRLNWCGWTLLPYPYSTPTIVTKVIGQMVYSPSTRISPSLAHTIASTDTL